MDWKPGAGPRAYAAEAVTPPHADGGLAPAQSPCASCPARRVCFVVGPTDTVPPQASFISRRRVREDDAVRLDGTPHRLVHVLRAGTVKSILAQADGREHLTGFHFPGELLGLEALGDGRHASYAIALEDSEVCAIPHVALSDTLPGTEPMQQRLWSAIAAQIVRGQALTASLATQGAEARVAAFLLDVSRRMQARGFAASEFHMRMSRAEIGSYLGLTLETVSRTLSAFHQQRLVAVRRRHIRVLDEAGLVRQADA